MPARASRLDLYAGVRDVLLVAFGYVIGTIPFALWITRRARIDIREQGSGNPGFSNVLRVLGPKYGIPVLLGDVGKGAAAAGLGWAITDSRLVGYAAGLAAVLGHCFPPYSRQKGGRGVASAGGVLFVMAPLSTLINLGIWAAVAFALKKASVASLLVAALSPVGVWLFGRPGAEIAYAAALAGVVLVRHYDNIRRLVRGQEKSLGT